MIKKAQIKFICVTMSILFCFFAIITCVTTVILHNSTNRNIDHSLNDMAKSIPFNTEKHAPDKSFIIKINDADNGYEIIYFDHSNFTEEQLNLLATEIEHTISAGKIDDIYYKFVEIRGDTFLLAIDATDYLNQQTSSVLRILVIYISIYALLFILVYLFSFSVFEPIKENFVRQQQFVSNASHELKTPLTIISANADVLKQSQQSQWVDNIKVQTERLETIISDMLEMAKLDEGTQKLIKEEFNLSDEIIKATLPFDALAFEKGKMLELDVIPNIIYKGNSESVKQILNILLDNAVKYANKDGLIKVSLTKKNGKYILSVYNTGSAVPANQAQKIFERFYRYDNSRSRETGGSGLGLAIAKSIALANKWKISAVSRPNEYMLITVTL